MPTFFQASATTIINLDRIESVFYDGKTIQLYYQKDYGSEVVRAYIDDDAAKIWNRLQQLSGGSKPYPRGHDEYPRPWADVRPIPDGDTALVDAAKRWEC
jgi:hypothetical protein